MKMESGIGKIKRTEPVKFFGSYYKEELNQNGQFGNKKGKKQEQEKEKDKKQTTSKTITPQEAYEREIAKRNNILISENGEKSKVREFKKTLNPKAGYKKYYEAQEYSAKIEDRRYQIEKNNEQQEK